MPRKRLARVVESGWVLRRKADGYIWSIGETGNPDARLGGRPVFEESPDLSSMSPEHWEMVHVTRTVTIEETARRTRQGRGRGRG